MAGKTFVLDAVDDRRDIAQVNRRAVFSASDDQIFVTVSVRDLAVRAQDQGCVFSVELSRAGIRSAGANRGG